MANKPIGAYATEQPEGWAAYDADGRTWKVDGETADQLETERANRNEKTQRPHT